MLDHRAQQLLKALVERYIAEGQPVGSRVLSRQSGLELSPATIRTAMIMGSVMGSFAVEQFSVGGIQNLTVQRIQARFDELAELAHFERVRL